ncbi:MAG: DJ-1/PfpI family protein [Alphaproteobacteria bacterium]|nr:DJ-1/PfpI family protein [Alphaproteobacteria bacterium]
MTAQLSGKKIMILVANGVDESVMSCVQRELVKTGATVKTVGIAPGIVNSWNAGTWGLYFPVDQQINQTLGSDFDCVIVPSGVRAVQKLAATPHSERILSSFVATNKHMVFMGDAIELLAQTNLATGHTVAGPESVEDAMTNAGATFAGADITCGDALMSGDCTDTEAFITRMIDFLANSADIELKAAA